MKFSQVRTIESLLKEYGLSSGAPTPVGQQQSGATAKSKSPSQAKSLSPSQAKSQSPTINPSSNKKDIMPTLQLKAKDITVDTVVKDRQGNEAGTIISQLGDEPNPDAVVVKDKAGKYSIAKADDEYTIDNPEFGKLLTNEKTSLRKKHNLKNKIKRLVKKSIKEADPALFEINFNRKELATSALNAPIRCGFEAETVWTDYSRGGGDDIDNMSFYEVEEWIYISDSDSSSFNEDFRNWIIENKIEDALDELIDDWVKYHEEDEEWLNDFIDSSDGPSEGAVERYKREYEETNPTDFENREEDGWEYMNWVRDVVEEEYMDEYRDWLRTLANDDGQLTDDAYQQVSDDYSLDEWISEEFYSMSSFLDDYGIDYSEINDGGLEDVASSIRLWATDNSENTSDIEVGDYGSTSTDGWAVESDSSIDGYGVGAEIISPVYNTPNEMLQEMKSLFNHMSSRETVETNTSTGLHVTMSWNGPEMGDDTASAEANKVKMAALLGDQYLMGTFGREKNSYTKSQLKNLKNVALKLKQNPENARSLEGIEKILASGISGDKFSSINFKSEKDRDSGYNLIEFRIGGGEDYHLDMEKIVKSVVRYATIMTAGYKEDAFKHDYINAIFRIIDKAGELDPREVSRTQQRLDLDNIQSPLVDVFKSLLSKDNYFDGISEIVNAISNLDTHEIYSQSGADANWKKQWQKYIKATGKDDSDLPPSLSKSLESINEIKEEEPIKGYIAPTKEKPSILQEEALNKAQDFYTKALGRLSVDISTNISRGKITAKTIGVFRKSLNDFQLDQTSLTNKVLSIIKDINIPTQNDRTDQKVAVVKKGIDALFKKKMISSPNFLSPPQVEKIVTKTWNALHSEKNDGKQEDKIADFLLQMNFGPDVDMASDGPHNMRQSWQEIKKKREFNEFYSSMTRSGYNHSSPPVMPGEIYYKEGYEELLKFTSTFPKYNEPVSPKHNRNLHNDDTYIDNYLNSYTMKLRKRFSYWEDLQKIDSELWWKSIKEVGRFTEEFVNDIKGDINPDQTLGEQFPQLLGTYWEDVNDSPRLLGFTTRNHTSIQDVLDDIVKGDFEDPMGLGGSVVYRLGDVLTDAIRTSLGAYYELKEEEPGNYKLPIVPNIINDRWKAYKTWMSKFDTVAQKFGFDSQADEIKDKTTIDKREKQFAKVKQERGKAMLNIPSHSMLYIAKDFFDRLNDEDHENPEMIVSAESDEFNKNVNTGRKVFVVAAAHWSQMLEARDIIQMLNDLKGYPLGTSQEWRREPAEQLIKAFYKEYGTPFSILQDPEKFVGSGQSGSQTSRSAMDGVLRRAGVEITNKGDSREGAPDKTTGEVQTALIPNDKTQNNKSGEPFNRSSATMWAMKDDNNAEAKRFNAHNWENWDPKHIEIIKKAVEGGQSFHMAFADFNDKYSPQLDLIAKEKGIDPNDNQYAGKTSQEIFKSLHQPMRSGRVPVGYAEARSNYEKFDYMMQNGMQFYMPRGEVNSLVGFLNHRDNDENFKARVLVAIKNNYITGGEPIQFQQALANARRNNESIFDKFDKLPLEEQLKTIEKISLKKIDKVYEGYWKNVDIEKQERPSTRIWKSEPNPMKTKKPYNPEKHKENFIKSLIAKGTSRQEAEKQAWVLAQKGHFNPKNNESINENVPNNTKVRIINKLLADHFPASDLRKQMDAFFAIPDTQMLSDFRHARAESGGDVCLRSILRRYVNTKLNTRLQKFVNLNEGKDELIAKIDSLPDDEQTQKLVSYIEQLILDTGAGGRIQSLSAELEVIPDEDVSKAIKQIAKIVASIEMSPSERAQLFVDWKADTLVNVNALLSTSTVTMKDIYKGYGDKGESHITELVDDLNQVVQYGVGPGEFALAVLSQRIAGIGASGSDEGKGDLLIDNKPVELKTTRKNAARFNDREVTFSPNYKNLVIQFFAKYDQKLEELQKEGVKVKVKSGMQQSHVAEFLKHVPEAEQEVAEIITNIFTNLDVGGGPIARMLAIGDINGAMQLLAQANVNNYLNKKRQSGNLLGILFIDLKKQTFNFIKDVSDLAGTGLRLHAKTNYLITTNENPFANTSIVPTSQG